MLALNEQLGEVGGILGTLLNASIIELPQRRANRFRETSPRGDESSPAADNRQTNPDRY